MKQALLLCVAGVTGVSACGKASSASDPAASATAIVSAGASATANDGGSVASAKAAPIESWQGSYKSAAATIALPKDVRWRVPETSAGLGEGTLALTIDPATGRVRGAVEGPLGPATLDGLASEGRLTATVGRQDSSDHGFIGTLAGDIGEGGAQGTMNVALAEASAVRTAAFQLAPVRGAPSGPGVVRPSHPRPEDEGPSTGARPIPRLSPSGT